MYGLLILYESGKYAEYFQMTNVAFFLCNAVHMNNVTSNGKLAERKQIMSKHLLLCALCVEMHSEFIQV